MEVVRALHPFKVQVKVGEFLHFKMGDVIPHDLLTGSYREYIMDHCEVSQTRAHVTVSKPERTIEPTAHLVKPPPPLKEQWKKVDAPVEVVKAPEPGHDQWATNGGPEPAQKPKAPEPPTPPVKTPHSGTPHGGAAMAKGAHDPQTAPASHKAPAKGGHTGKGKPHA